VLPLRKVGSTVGGRPDQPASDCAPNRRRQVPAQVTRGGLEGLIEIDVGEAFSWNEQACGVHVISITIPYVFDAAPPWSAGVLRWGVVISGIVAHHKQRGPKTADSGGNLWGGSCLAWGNCRRPTPDSRA
jgi:hypothetical protein